MKTVLFTRNVYVQKSVGYLQKKRVCTEKIKDG